MITEEFYTKLAEGATIDIAMTAARKEAFLNSEGDTNLPFGTPIIYMNPEPDQRIVSEVLGQYRNRERIISLQDVIGKRQYAG